MAAKPSYDELEKKLQQAETELQNLRKSAELFKALMEQSPTSIEIYSPDGYHQQVNAAWQELLQVKLEDTIGKYNCLQDEQAVKLGAATAFAQVLAGQPITLPDFQYDPAASGYPQGRKRWLRSNFFAIKDAAGQVQHVVLMHEDITDLKQAEKKLALQQEQLEKLVQSRTQELMQANKKLQEQFAQRRQTENQLIEAKNKLEAVLAAIGDGLTVQDRDFRIIYQNAAQMKLQGEQLGQHCYQAYHKRNGICPNCALAKSFADGLIHKHETSASTDHGTIYLEVTSCPVRNADGEMIAGVEVVRDITDQKKQAAQLMQRQKMEAVGTLAGGIAHDFNNILTGILGYAELALMDVKSGQADPEPLEEIIRASRRAADLIAQILTLSRQQEPKQEFLQLQTVIQEAMKLMRGTLPSTIAIHQEIAPACPPILGDATQIHQVIVNLCANAFHALRENGGSLTVSLQELTLAAELTGEPENVPPGHYTRLSITDTGHGMAPDTLARIFEPYFTRKQLGEGSGLGLATVHGIVHNHHGYIVVASQLDQGTRFDLYFPATPFTTATMPVPRAEKHLSKMRGRVLLVDDEEMVINITSTLLTRCGCQVTPFKDSLEALARFTAAPTAFDLVITDQTMPGITGFALAQKILALQPGMPIILMSGHSDTVDKGKALAAGIRQYLMKPIDIHGFADTVAAILAGQQ